MKKEKHYKYLGLILINGGSSFYHDDTIGKVAINTVKQCKQDWDHLDFKDHVFSVYVYDISKFNDGWIFDYQLGMRCPKTKKPIKLLKEVFAV
tara:strand:+ start:1810 stop:2088 length:279 start_codon:yes stop_codon:yes gene_type:complete